jgi:hypothetical protein
MDAASRTGPAGGSGEAAGGCVCVLWAIGVNDPEPTKTAKSFRPPLSTSTRHTTSRSLLRPTRPRSASRFPNSCPADKARQHHGGLCLAQPPRRRSTTAQTTAQTRCTGPERDPQVSPNWPLAFCQVCVGRGVRPCCSRGLWVWLAARCGVCFVSGEVARRGLIRCVCGLRGRGSCAVSGVRRGPCLRSELEGSKLRMRACARSVW